MFNFEGGCYAKCIKLSAEAEPEIWDATNRFGAVLENVEFDPETRISEFRQRQEDREYPLRLSDRLHPERLDAPARAGQPKNIIFLTADAFGVMPPIAKLNPAQAMYHFLSGYTAKVAGTEKGLVGVEPEFSTCFAAPFLPRPPAEYGRLLRDYIGKHNVDCWLVNSGWTGGIYGTGRRMPIKVDPRAGDRCAGRFAERRELSHRSLFRLSRCRPRCRASSRTALSDENLEGQSRVRRDRAQAGAACSRRTSPNTKNTVDADVRAAAPEVRLAAE